MSRPRGDGDYGYRKEFYKNAEVAADYDRHRFQSGKRKRRNRRKWRAIQRALAGTEGVRRILDLPSGTGRFTPQLIEADYQVIASDISREMMAVSRAEQAPDNGLLGYAQADAERLPFRSDSIDCVLSIRFFLHVDPETRVRILREFGRISRRWLVIDYRHRYTLRWLVWRLKSALGWTEERRERVSRAQLLSELRAADLRFHRIIPVEWAFSDKWIVLAEVPARGPEV